MDDDFLDDDDYDVLDSEPEQIIEPKYVKLNENIIREITGKRDLVQLERLEILFDVVSELGGLEKCRNLQELWLTHNSLQSISSLSCLKYTLQSLSLVDQNITKIENLDELVNLRELLLYSNQITRIENLNKCTKLQKLWLNSNKIEEIENLDSLTELRQLWLQDNKITEIPRSFSLPKLQELALSGNQIVDLKSIAPLQQFNSLQCLSFNDRLHFPSPIAKLEGYKSFVIFHLPQVQVLDFETVYDRDRQKVQELYKKSITSVNEQLATLRNDIREQLHQLDIRKKNLEKHCVDMGVILHDELLTLEARIADTSRAASRLSDKKGLDVSSRRKPLYQSLANIQHKYYSDANQLLNRESSILEVEPKFYSDVLRKANTVQNSILEIDKTCYELDPSAMEHRFVQKHFNATMKKEHSGESFKIHQIFKFENSSKANGSYRMYLPVSVNNLFQVLEYGAITDFKKGTQLYSTAKLAHQQSNHSSFTLNCLLLYQVTMASVLPHVFSSSKHHTPRQQESTQTVFNPDTILLDYIITYYKLDDVHLTNKMELDGMYSALESLEIQSEGDFLQYKLSTWEKIQPDIYDKLKKNESGIQKLKNELLAVKRKIREERSTQEDIIRNYRSKA